MRKNLLKETGILKLRDEAFSMDNIDIGLYTGSKFMLIEDFLNNEIGKEVEISVIDSKDKHKYFIYEGVLTRAGNMIQGGDFYIGENNLINALWSLTETKVDIRINVITEDEMEGDF